MTIMTTAKIDMYIPTANAISSSKLPNSVSEINKSTFYISFYCGFLYIDAHRYTILYTTF